MTLDTKLYSFLYLCRCHVWGKIIPFDLWRLKLPATVPRGGKKARARVTSIQTKPFCFSGWPCVLCPRGIKIIVLKMYSGIFLFRKKPLRIYNLHLLKLRDFGRTIYSIGFLYCCANGSSSLCYQ